MSGGHFDYQQDHILYIVEKIKEQLSNNAGEELLQLEQYAHPYSDETINVFYDAIEALKKAYVYAQRIDYFLSSDDGEQTFHKRLTDELAEIAEDAEDERIAAERLANITPDTVFLSYEEVFKDVK